MPLKIVRNDITKMKVDAVVNAANTELRMGGGVCGAIFAAAGAEKLQEECSRIGSCGVGDAVITRGFDLPAKYIIHTVGPVWQGGGMGEAGLLRGCYINSLKLALKHKCRSIAFPLISSGIYGYPKDQALSIAVSAISEFVLENDIDAYLVVFDRKSFVLSEKLLSAIEKYIDDNYADERIEKERFRGMEQYDVRLFESMADIDSTYAAEDAAMPKYRKKGGRSLDDIVGKLDETFSQMLLRLIDEKGMTDVMVYKKANVDRRLFSKIRSNKNYKPSKITAIAFAIALELNLDETLDLMGRAGYTLSHSSKFDVIIEYFITEGIYNIFEINEALFAFGQDLLGA
jgi:O-acetyl-ADP-ribose deacetylase (regulator of RNase III)